MIQKYNTHYHDYLGINREEIKKGKVVFSSEQRDVPLNRKYYYRIICTTIGDKVIFSVSPSLFDKFNEFVDGKEVDSLEIDKKLLHEFSKLVLCDNEIRYFLRFGLSERYRSIDIKNVHVLTEKILNNRIGNLSFKDQQRALKNSVLDIKEKRKFEINEDGKVASMAKISDVDFGGGNIAVYTGENYRKKGYGKILVHACIEWCKKRDVLPIYLVDSTNRPSVNLAKSIGFEIISEEIVISTIK